jgi:hypothetical protein
MDLSGKNMLLIFVDFDSPDQKVVKASREAIAILEKVAPWFETQFKAFYVPDKRIEKRLLGVTWETMPSMAFNSQDQQVLPYPKGRAITEDSVKDWLKSIAKGTIQANAKPQGHDFKTKMADPTLYANFLMDTVKVGRDTW